MKKIVLLTASILAISGSIMAKENNSFISQDSKIEGAFRTAIEIKDTAGNSDYTYKTTVADGYVKDSSWNGWELGYYVFRDASGNRMAENVMSGELKPKYSAKTSWGSWSETTALVTEYTAKGIQQDFTIDYQLDKTSSISGLISGKYVTGEDDFLVKLFETRLNYRKFLSKGMFGLELRVLPLNYTAKRGTVGGDQSVWSTRMSYGRNVGVKNFVMGFVDYENGTDDAFIYKLNNTTDLTHLKIGVMESYKITPTLEIMTNIEQKIALAYRNVDTNDVNGTAVASNDETSIGLGLKYSW